MPGSEMSELPSSFQFREINIVSENILRTHFCQQPFPNSVYVITVEPVLSGRHSRGMAK